MDTEFSILINYLSQNLSVDEQETLAHWRALSPENEALFGEVSQLRLLNEYNRRNTVSQTALALFRVQTEIKRRKRTRRLRSVAKYAAAALLVIGLSVLGWSRMTAEKYTAISVAPHEPMKKIHLSDGTTVWLSAASELRIPESFSAARRNVALTGKAFFDVAKNPEYPFTITSPYVNVKVAGTSFDLTVSESGKHVETILVSGKVILQDSRRRDIFVMSPGEKVEYDWRLNTYNVKTVDTNTLTAWHLDQITFENATLREIVNKLSLIYDVNINLQSKKLADRYYRYVINKEETLTQVLDMLSYLAPINYTIEGDEVFISE